MRIHIGHLLLKAKKLYPKIKFLDEAEIFSDYENKEELYNENYHSPKANRLIADYIQLNI